MVFVSSTPLSATFRVDHLAAGAWLAGEDVAWLEGGGGPPGLAWNSLVTVGAPRRVLETRDENPFPILAAALAEPCDADAPSGGFLGGAIGYIGYECGRFVEKLPTASERIFDIPDCRFQFPGAWVARSAAGEIRIFCISESRGRAAERALDAARTHALRLELLGSHREKTPAIESRVVPLWSRDRYIQSVDWIREQIAAGEIYQANLSQPFLAARVPDPFDVFLRLVAQNPSPFAGFLGFGRHAVVSSSPELYLKRNGTRVETRPIKGTRARTGDAPADEARARELESSEKEAAELAMIVDLERNDLSRVCEPGSVRVATARSIETYATVFHGVATVEGTMSPGRKLNDLLVATFPGGSVTGCPKIRAIELLHEIEREPRGVSFGALGWLQYGEDALLNLAIRTLTFERQAGAGPGEWNCTFRTGGGIVADSDPASEYDESFAKARALAEALGDSKFAKGLAAATVRP
jgi:para-aminobenzoate synthetase component 1